MIIQPFDLIYYGLAIHPLSLFNPNYINNTFRYKIFNCYFELERNWYYVKNCFYDKDNLKEFILEN